jgi:DNA polymerase-1
MLEIEKSIASENLNVNLLLQIHDELIFEAKREDASEYADRFREMMENIYPLDTRLVCSVSIGDSWDTLK